MVLSNRGDLPIYYKILLENNDYFTQPAVMGDATGKETREMIRLIRNLKIRFKLYILIGVALMGMLIIGGMSFSVRGLSPPPLMMQKNPAFCISKVKKKIWKPS